MIRVMLVDDEPLILEGLRYIIDWESMGFEIVATARNGQEALELSRVLPFDLLITDINMPELTGLELIEALNMEKSHIKTMILSGFQEFDLVKKGLKLGIENYLLKPIQETELVSSLLHVKEKINRTLLEEKSMLVLRDHAIWRWITGKMEGKEFKERIALYPSLQLTTPFWLGLFKLEWEEQSESYLHSLQEKIEQTTKAVAVLTPSGDLLLLWTGLDSEAEWEAEKAAFDLFLQKLDLPEDYVFVLSERLDSFHQVHQTYRELEMTCELKLLLPNQEHGMAEQLYLKGNRGRAAAEPQPAHHVKPELLEQLANEQYTAVKASLSELLQGMEQDQQQRPFLLRSILLEFFFQVKNKFFISMEYEQYVHMIYQMLYIETFEEAMKVVEQCIQMMEGHADQEGGEYSPIIQTIINYIHQNYAEDMSLKTLGHSFHINPIYLGQVFQKEVKCSFTKYLTKLRMDRAKKLLLNSHEKAGNIGKKVGYPDATYFYKQFKKMEGVTPSEWRKIHLNV
ncbi:response regulator transcription factor [Caldalkalibacillus mannanilyticus]|uniref:response regulator transcription factor n=1 Tax=Caldalkalibacillus mannanilyticus TaxID=1418 RepID=UPI000468A51F|nr:response regulator transcription factor [Caldalkalibacillus mannanilyticus]